MEPITRKEMYLAKAGGKDVPLPEPVTREEMFLAKIAQGGGSGDGSGGSADWNASEGEAGHVKNRTHYEEITEIATIAEEQSAVNNSEYGFTFNGEPFVVGENYIVIMDGVEYKRTALSTNGMVYIGMTEAIGGTDPFMFVYGDGTGHVGLFADDATHTFKITTTGVKVHKLEKKFLPDSIASLAEIRTVRLKLDNFSIRSIVDNGVRMFRWDFSISYEDVFEAAKTGGLVLYDANGAFSVTPSTNIENNNLFVRFSDAWDAYNVYRVTLFASNQGYFTVNNLHKVTQEPVTL